MMITNIRLIKKNEIKACAALLAECFLDYPLYGILYPNDKTRKRNLRMFYEVSLYTRRNYTYVSDDLSFVGCIRRPSDKQKSIIRTIFHPKFFFTCLPAFNFGLLNRYNDFLNATNESRNKNYDPSKDAFIEVIGMRKDKRSLRYFISLFKDNYNNESVYAETMKKELIRLYEYIGFKKVGETEYKGEMNYVFKKESE